MPSPVDAGKGLRPALRKELEIVLRELEDIVKVLRVAAVEAPSASGRKNALASDQAPAQQWVLDSTEAMVDKGQLVTPL